jgi:mannose-6-phosphate isomerase-like protein (cupin superfamily)
MAEVTWKRIDEMEGHEGKFLHARKELGVTAFGMNVLKLGPNWEGYPDHDHAKDGQEEVYTVLEGSATLVTPDQSWDLVPGVMARVGAQQKRKIVPGGGGVTLLVIGGTPGKAYEPSTS